MGSMYKKLMPFFSKKKTGDIVNELYINKTITPPVEMIDAYLNELDYEANKKVIDFIETKEKKGGINAAEEYILNKAKELGITKSIDRIRRGGTQKQSARRLRSSKARKSRKARKARATRRK
jgi:hypothetical protein